MAKRPMSPQAKPFADLTGILTALLAVFVILRAAGVLLVSLDWLWGFGVCLLCVFIWCIRIQMDTTPKGD
jgi:hypothetical protein